MKQIPINTVYFPVNTVHLSVILVILTLLIVLPVGTGTAKAVFQSASEPSAMAQPATAVPQPLPFSQNWSNTGMITTNDD
jgi:hypothetical protein